MTSLRPNHSVAERPLQPLKAFLNLWTGTRCRLYYIVLQTFALQEAWEHNCKVKSNLNALALACVYPYQQRLAMSKARVWKKEDAGRIVKGHTWLHGVDLQTTIVVLRNTSDGNENRLVR